MVGHLVLIEHPFHITRCQFQYIHEPQEGGYRAWYRCSTCPSGYRALVYTEELGSRVLGSKVGTGAEFAVLGDVHLA